MILKLASFVLASISICYVSISKSALAVSSDSITNAPVLKPFRMGVLSIDAPLNETKPLAKADSAGWTLDGSNIYGTYQDGWFTSYNLETKKPRWWVDAGSKAMIPALVHESYVYSGFQDGAVKKLDITSGKVEWSTSLDAYANREILYQGGLIFVQSSSQKLYCIDTRDGQIKWLFDPGFPDNLVVSHPTHPIAYKDMIIIGVNSGAIIAVDKSTGTRIWDYKVPTKGSSRFYDTVGEFAVIGDRLIIARYDGTVASLSIGSRMPSINWQKSLPAVSTAKVHNGILYLATVSGDAQAYNADTGEQMWKVSLTKGIINMNFYNDLIYLSSGAGKVMAIDHKGNLQWIDDLGGRLAAKPFRWKDGIYYSTGLKNLYGYKL